MKKKHEYTELEWAAFNQKIWAFVSGCFVENGFFYEHDNEDNPHRPCKRCGVTTAKKKFSFTPNFHLDLNLWSKVWECFDAHEDHGWFEYFEESWSWFGPCYSFTADAKDLTLNMIAMLEDSEQNGDLT